MTEQEWLACDDPMSMLLFVPHKASDRKLRSPGRTFAAVGRSISSSANADPHTNCRIASPSFDSGIGRPVWSFSVAVGSMPRCRYGVANSSFGVTGSEGILLSGDAPSDSLRRGIGQVSEGVPMWRVIVRISLTSDHNSRLRRHLANLFSAMNLQNTGTGIWESAAVPPALAAAQMAQIFAALANPQRTVTGVAAFAALEHLWVYLDRV